MAQTSAPWPARGVLVHGRSLVKSGKLAEIIGNAKTVRTWEHGGGEPTVDGVDALRAELKRDRPDWVAAVGGGSMIELAKAAAGLVDAPETTAFYRAVIAEDVAYLNTFVSEVLASGSTAANPRTVTAEDARQLLTEITKAD